VPLTDALSEPEGLPLPLGEPLEDTDGDPLLVMVVLTVPDDEMEPEPLADPDGDCVGERLPLRVTDTVPQPEDVIVPLTDTLRVPEELPLPLGELLEDTESDPLLVMVALTVPVDEMELDAVALGDNEATGEVEGDTLALDDVEALPLPEIEPAAEVEAL